MPKLFLSWLPAAASVVSVIFILCYPLGEQKVTKIIEQLNQKRQQTHA